METTGNVHKKNDSGKAFAEGDSPTKDETPRVTFLRVAKAVSTKLGAQMKQRPMIALGAAAGVGFILGGGLSTKAGRLAVLALLEYAVTLSKGSRDDRASFIDA